MRHAKLVNRLRKQTRAANKAFREGRRDARFAAYRRKLGIAYHRLLESVA